MTRHHHTWTALALEGPRHSKPFSLKLRVPTDWLLSPMLSNFSTMGAMFVLLVVGVGCGVLQGVWRLLSSFSSVQSKQALCVCVCVKGG